MTGSGQQGHDQLGLFFWKIDPNKAVLLGQSKEIIPDCIQFVMRGLIKLFCQRTLLRGQFHQ